jgi:putative ABC transport system ATP-binding protein
MVSDLSEVPAETYEVKLAAGASLFEQEDPSDVVYVIDSGEIDIIRILAGGEEQPLARLGPGQYLGELGPLMGFPRSASARAATEARLTAMSPHLFRERMLDKGNADQPER